MFGVFVKLADRDQAVLGLGSNLLLLYVRQNGVLEVDSVLMAV